MRILLSILLCFVTSHNLKEQPGVESITKIKSSKEEVKVSEEKVKVDTPTPVVKAVVKVIDINTATWYSLHGNTTASGEMFHRDSLTAAYNFCELGTYLRVTNISNNESVIVKVNDRMGYKGKNHIDLSKCAFDSIGNISSGRIKVKIEIF
jgi:rare lipoprotein A (peptidoglycan hydrolase)